MNGAQTPKLPTRVFQIGFNRAGTKFLAETFRLNGYRARHWENGALAEELFYAKATGGVPFADAAAGTLFCDIESVHKPALPVLEGFREFAFLERCYPDALFVLNTRDVDKWLISRLSHDGGAYARLQAQRRGVWIGDLAEIWMEEWEAHLATVEAHFAGSERLVRFDLDADPPEALAERLAPWVTLSQFPENRDAKSDEDHARRAQKLFDFLDPPPVARRDASGDTAFVDTLVDFATRDGAGGLGALEPSAGFATWDGGDRLALATGGTVRLGRWAGPQGDRALVPPGAPVEVQRAGFVVNTVLGLGRETELAIDMEPGRRGSLLAFLMGHDRVVVASREAGAQGLVLWPRSRAHAIGDPRFFGPEPADRIALADKEDRVAWRGPLTGTGKSGRAATRVLSDLLRGEGVPERLLKDLAATSRHAFLEAHVDKPDFDIGAVLSGPHAALAEAGPLARHARPAQPPGWFHRFAHVVCLTGLEGAENLPAALASNSVVYLEEDGWEAFYSPLFRPWEHYVPLSRGAADFDEKLDWARSNPAACAEMAATRAPIAAQLGRVDLRVAHLNGVLDVLEARQG